MENAVEALSPSAPNMMTKNGIRGTTGKNPSFFRTTGKGDTKCWLAVDSETGTIDIRDEEEKTLIEINAQEKKAILAGLDLGKGIADAQDRADGAARGVAEAKVEIRNVLEAARTAQVTADQAVEDAAAVSSAVFRKIKESGLEMQHEKILTTRKDGQLLINGVEFKGEKGEPGERGPQGLQGVQGEKGERGLRGPEGEKGVAGTSKFIDIFENKYPDPPVDYSSSRVKDKLKLVNIRKREKFFMLTRGKPFMIYRKDLRIKESSPVKLTVTANYAFTGEKRSPAARVIQTLKIGSEFQKTMVSTYALPEYSETEPFHGYSSYGSIIDEVLNSTYSADHYQCSEIIVPALPVGTHTFELTVDARSPEWAGINEITVAVSYL